MTDTNPNAYDVLPYGSHSFPQSQPDRLAVIARVMGLAPASAGQCRVLELGCASGGNLIPLAVTAPGSTFVGIDLSARQIADAQAIVAELGLTNIEFRQMDLADADESLGKFDYIIAHGVYSWVPSPVQDRLLAICKSHLVSNGVAYVSYNTYPGWRMRGMLRDMMLYHSRRFNDVQLKVAQARALLDFLAQNVSTENNPYGIMLKQELEGLRQQADSYLYHEHLEEVNEPVYFHQFAERVAQHGLEYLGESEFHTMLATNFPQQVADTLRNIAPDVVMMEQYMDFLRNRVFRQTLLVHKGALIQRNIDWKAVTGLHVASTAKAVSAKPDLRSTAIETFRAPNGAALNTPVPIVKAAFSILAERWPQPIPFAELCVAARARVDGLPYGTQDAVPAPEDMRALGVDLLQAYAGAIVELWHCPPRYTLRPGPRPKAGAMARYEARRGTRVTNLRHEPVNLDRFNQQLIQRLDGVRDRASIIEECVGLVLDGTITIQVEGKNVMDREEIRKILVDAVDSNIASLARVALIEE